MITKAIHNAFRFARDRQWEKTYWAVDIHGTMIIPNYRGGEIPKSFYPYAVEALQLVSRRDDVCLILYTCSHPHEIDEYLEYFRTHEIHFRFVNENPEVENGAYGCYNDKPYFNVLFEDKAGFDPEEDWKHVHDLMLQLQK
ncbi:MAG: hypothetical protein FD123_1127 [Bacteroidetes bacterium]|nr:MAG: hypothetical protein FD123_1127 [Bacteroidota bacterium]